jgi:hypothetical protein
MNQELPKPVRQALARGTGGDAHPSLDVLTAFAEQALTGNEKQGVGDHLAQCADCREILFMANRAVEEGIGIEQELVAAASDRRSVSEGAYATTASRPKAAAALASSPRRKGIPLVWALAAMAGVAIVSSVAVWRYGRNFGSQPVPTVAENVQAPAATNPEKKPAANGHSTKGAGHGALSKTEPAKAAPSPKENVLASSAGSRGAEERPSAPMMAQAQSANQPPAPTAFGKAKVAVPAASLRTGFASSAADSSTTETIGAGGPVAKPQMSARELSAARGKWRISSDGHIERLIGPNYWTRVPVNQDTRFRVVSLVDGNVWVGGSGGALFHSRNGGLNWNRVVLSGETATVVSIQFDDAQRGTVTTSGGTRWSTSDGGVTWTKQ